MISLDLLSLQPFLKTKRENEKRYLFCPIRKKYLVLQPEELVRQLLLIFFMEKKGYPKSRITVEKSLKHFSKTPTKLDLEKRFDVLVYNKDTNPFLLVECKSPEVKISQSTFEQISQYNFTLRVPYLLVTNGISTFCCKMDYEKEDYEFIDDLPTLL